jgi:predicted nucleic acid-binding protein
VDRAPGPPQPPGGVRLDEWEEWIERNAAQARRALLDPVVCAELLALLGVDDSDQRRERRLAEARRDLASMELRWKLAEDEVWEA